MSSSIRVAGGRQLLTGRCADFDDLSALLATWGLDFRPLDRGPLPSGLMQLSEADAVVQQLELGNAYEQRLVSPPGFRCFGVLKPTTQGVRLHGHDFPESAIGLFPMGDEFSASSLPRFVGWTLAIDEARIVAAMDSVDLPEAARPGPQERGHVAVEAGHAQRLARRLAALFESLATGETPLDSSAITDELAFQIPLDLARAFASGTLPARTASSRSRDIAIRRAIEYIEDNRGEPLTVRDLVREAGVGWTTLVHAFHEHFGVTPKAYLQAVRLVGVRRDLREADRGTLIADVANRWGFWHQGQFAADYRRKFGELPSETLARASAG